jgi:hypothetical protein
MRSLLLTLVLVAIPGCGSGNIGDLFSIFPPEAFNPDAGDGGDVPGLPGAGGTAEEVGFIEASQGVDGDVRNIALAQVGSDTYAFLSAGTAGLHVVKTTEPERVNSNYIANIDPGLLDGGRCDTLAVIDNTYIVAVAVGSGAPNAVTVFHIPTILTQAAEGGDVGEAKFQRTGFEIAVPGVDGNGGGVSGTASAFVVATGGPSLGLGLIESQDSTWAAATVQPEGAPPVDHFTDVVLTTGALFLSVISGDVYGILAATLSGTPPDVNIAIQTPAPIDMEQPSDNNADINNVLQRDVVGPGNYPLDLDFDAFTLFVTGDRDVRLFTATSPSSLGQPTIAENGQVDTIAVDARSGTFAVGQSTRVQIWSVGLGGSGPTPIVDFDFSGVGVNVRVRGVRLTSSRSGNFVLCCAGQRGLRVLQWSQGGFG